MLQRPALVKACRTTSLTGKRCIEGVQQKAIASRKFATSFPVRKRSNAVRNFRIGYSNGLTVPVNARSPKLSWANRVPRLSTRRKQQIIRCAKTSSSEIYHGMSKVCEIGSPAAGPQPYKVPVRSKYLWPSAWIRPQDLGKKEDASTGPNLFHLDSSWTSKYHSMLDTGKRPSLKFSLKVARGVKPLFGRLLGGRVGIKSMHLAWMHVQPQYQSRLWQDLMLFCLQHSPKKALLLLLASTKGYNLRPARHVVADCLHHVARYYLYKVSNPDPWALSAILHVVKKFVDCGHAGQLVQSVPEQVSFLLLKHCSDQQVSSLLEHFTKERVKLHANTLLHALARSLDAGNVRLSLQMLKAVSESGLGTHRDQVQSACVRLITSQFGVPNQFAIQMRILNEILEMEIHPGIPFYNAILLNAVEAEQLSFAFELYEIAISNGFRPDSTSYRIILGACIRHNELGRCRRLVNEIENNVDLLKDPGLTSTLFHAVTKYVRPAYPFMVSVYRRHWDVRPLVELGLLHLNEEGVDAHGANRVQWPSPITISQILCAYIQMQRKTDDLFELYNRYHRQVETNHPLISLVANTDHVSNAFLLALGRSSSTLIHCPVIVRDMLDDSRSQRLSNKPEQAYPAASPPTARTWSILAASYFQHGQRRAAEKVLELMQERGIQRDQVTWETIVQGYASLQDVKRTVEAAAEMQVAGFKLNRRTSTNLRRVGQRDILVETSPPKGDDNSGPSKFEIRCDEQQPTLKPDTAVSRQNIQGLSESKVKHRLRKQYENLVTEQRRRESVPKCE